jgi:hypothetical protein
MIMNKERFLKVLIVSLVMFMAIGLLASPSMAQQVYSQYMMQAPYGQRIGDTRNSDGDIVPGDTILLDNMQYWSDARNWGWTPIEPPYPIYGAGMGYGTLQTVVDFEEGSRVLDVYRPASVFLPFNSQYMPFTIVKSAIYLNPNTSEVEAIPGPGGWHQYPDDYKGETPGEGYDLFSFKVRAPLAFEQFDTFSVIVNVETYHPNGSDPNEPGYAQIVMVPRDKVVGSFEANEDSVACADTYLSDDSKKPSTITVYMGRQFQDGSWHFVMEDLTKIIQNYTGQSPAETLVKITGLMFRGNMYRLDDIMFTKAAKSIANNHVPYLFRIGPVYGQLFNTMDMRFIFAEDEDLHMYLSPEGEFYHEDAKDNFLWGIKDADGHYHGEDDFDPSTAEFDPPQTPESANLYFKFTMGGPTGPTTNNIAMPVAIDPNNIPLQYLPHLGGASSITCVGGMPGWVWNTTPSRSTLWEEDDITLDEVNERLAKNPMYVLAKALQDAEYTYWPGVMILLPSQGQVLEDYIVTCRVSDHPMYGLTDEETFPVSVVNYDVTNHPPLIEQLEDQFFSVGETSVYQITATDPDLQYGDMMGLSYRATLNGLASYSYGPWSEPIINQNTGTISLTPQFEGALTCVVTVTDPRGMSAVGHFTIFCVYPGGFYNHAPAVLKIIQSPQVVKAGQLFILKELNIKDPDGQPLYYSCNIGAVGSNGIYTFQSEFPGEYLVQITAYDMLGGAVTQQFMLEVLPWWAY